MWDELISMADKRGIGLPENAAGSFEEYFRLLKEANQKQNLTRITGEREVLIKHFLDSLEMLSWCPDPRGRLLDVGSGAGLPGIPLKLARPTLDVVLLDSEAKKVRFMQNSAEALRLKGISALHRRAEDLAREDGFRDSFDIVVSRALAGLNILCELCLPFVRPGGYFIAYKGPGFAEELEASGHALLELSSRVSGTHIYELPEGAGNRVLVIIRKEGRTPQRYPRKAGIPAKRPLS